VDPLSQVIANAERENRRDRQKDSLTLVCAALVAQHNTILGLVERVESLEREVGKLHEPW
jgi:hypothetical protein